MPTTISTALVPVALKKNAAPTKIARITQGITLPESELSAVSAFLFLNAIYPAINKPIISTSEIIISGITLSASTPS